MGPIQAAKVRTQTNMLYSENKDKLQELIDKPNCGFNCPPGKPFCCDHKGCIRIYREFWTDEEKAERFSEEDLAEIDKVFDEKKGFLRDDGCVLPRKLRPFTCLAAKCSHSIKQGAIK